MMDEEYRARVIQDGAVVAQAFGDRDSVIREGQHYHAVYLADGPADLVLQVKRGGRWRFVDMTPPAPPKLAPWEAAYDDWLKTAPTLAGCHMTWIAAVEWYDGQIGMVAQNERGHVSLSDIRRRTMGDDA